MIYWNPEKEFPTRKELIKQGEILECPKCMKMGMPVRWSKQAQPFFSCPSYPDCKTTRNWMAELGWPSYDWKDILKAEGKIDPEQASMPVSKEVNKDDPEFWRDKFLEEREFVMQQLHDLKNIYAALNGRVEKLEKLQTTESSTEAPLYEDDIPF